VTNPSDVASNLESLINRSRTHPHARRSSRSSDQEGFHGRIQPLTPHVPPQQLQDQPDSPTEPAAVPPTRRLSAFGQAIDQHQHRIPTIREASYDDGAAILLGDDDDDADTERDERSSLLTSARKGDRRRSYGATSEPVGHRADRRDRGDRRRSDTSRRGAGTSRSRSVARTPPRRDPLPLSATESSSTLATEEDSRGRDTEERPLSPVSSRYSIDGGRHRRGSMAARFGDDSSGDEGGDVVRGLLATGGGAAFGARVGMGANAAGPAGSTQLEVDPAEELCAEDLELPIADDGSEGRDWTEAFRVGQQRRVEGPS
jgi:MATE family multidrug resistance protein